MTIPKVICFAGARGAGKDTQAQLLIKYFGQRSLSSMYLPLARPLKDLVRDLFGASSLQLWGTDVQKGELLVCGKTVREVMQQTGIFLRGVDPMCLLRWWDTAYQEADLQDPTHSKYCFVTDVRYPNEAAYLREMRGACVIHLLRAPYGDTTETECALNTVETNAFTLEIDNRNQTVEETHKLILSELLRLYPMSQCFKVHDVSQLRPASGCDKRGEKGLPA
jgi:hypothetical protein